MAHPRVIVVGGGLSGLSAAHTVYLNGGSVLVLDKNNFFGGNSTKATSGINGALTRTQVDHKIGDSVKQFYDDTVKSARDKARPDLIKVLTYQSAAAVEWLQDVFNLDLTLVSRLGGHSFPRTHRGHDAKFPGMAITYALMQRLEELEESDPERVQVIKKAKVVSLNKEGNTITGVTYEHNGETLTADGVVVLATGGYAADFTETSLLRKHRPDTYDLSTTNGSHATGDGHKMVMAIGGNDIDMDKVQVHPTGLVDPKEPNAKTKFLAAEALRGEGGLLINSDGERFVDELQHRDYVSNKLWEEKKKGKWPIRLVLNSKASNVLDFHTRHYAGRGLMKKLTGAELAKEIGVPASKLDATFKEYNEVASGKKQDKFGKKYFHNGPVEVDDTFYVAVMEPVLHFTMGGIEINDKAEVLNGEKKPFESLYACGELAGGVHGANRLGGSSLLGCVVYGRVAGASASQYLFQKLSRGGATGAAQRLGQISLHIDPSAPGKISVEWGSQAAGGAAGTPAPNTEYTLEEVAKHNKKDDLWIAVKGVVMDVTNWLDEHPGGAQALFSHMGRDATEEFEMLHDDEVIPKYAASIVIGRVKGQETPLLTLFRTPSPSAPSLVQPAPTPPSAVHICARDTRGKWRRTHVMDKAMESATKDVFEKGKSLTKAIAAHESTATVVAILQDLKSTVKPTEKLLRESQIGRTVNKIKGIQGLDPQVQQLASEIISRWRHLINEQKAASGHASTPGNARRGTGETNLEDGLPRDSITSDVARNNCIGLLYDGLAFMSTLPMRDILQFAKDIEAACLALPGTDKSPTSAVYKEKIRSLYQNLKNKSNPGLREKILEGKITPSRFATIPSPN
ncbi:hypothetical protein DV737_g1111, partial [Chaetothyriales sp. CBS 132003]